MIFFFPPEEFLCYLDSQLEESDTSQANFRNGVCFKDMPGSGRGKNSLEPAVALPEGPRWPGVWWHTAPLQKGTLRAACPTAALRVCRAGCPNLVGLFALDFPFLSAAPGTTPVPHLSVACVWPALTSLRARSPLVKWSGTRLLWLCCQQGWIHILAALCTDGVTLGR